MQNLTTLLQHKAEKALKSAFRDQIEESNPLLIPEVVQTTQEYFGHYQCNNALKLAKILRSSPKLIAEKIAAHFEKNSMIAKIEVAGNGFINITLDSTFLSKQVDALFRDSRLGVPPLKKKEKIIVEFSSPNVAKELHVGHLRSTIIGDSLARLFEFLGYEVLRLSHIGDWGTQFGMLIVYLKMEAPLVLTGEEETDIFKLMQWYKESKKRFDSDPEFKKRAQMQVVELQNGDPEALKAWSIICDISRKSYQEIYDLLDIKLIERGESFYNPLLYPLIHDLEKLGLITLSDGAKCIFLEGFKNREGEPLPMIVQKSDGGFNYDTTDMAAIRHRIDVEKADRIIYVTDSGQSLHFTMIFEAAKKAGFLDPYKVRVDHVPFGVVLGPDGKKFKTRSGDTEKLIDLLHEAIAHAREILRERLTDAGDEELDRLARVLGIDAVKYADLSCHRVKDYLFSYERMLKFEGNTAAFLLYSYVRIQSIKRKVSKPIDEVEKRAHIILFHPSEISLGLHLRQFGEVLDMLSRDLLPNRLCEYLYILAEKFNAFFRDCRVEGSPEEESRLLLCEASGRVLKQGLEILGLHTVNRM